MFNQLLKINNLSNDSSFVAKEDAEPSTYLCALDIKLNFCATGCEKQEPKKQEKRFLANDPIEW